MPTLVGPGFANFQDLVPPLVASGQVEPVTAGQLAERLRAALDKASLRPGPPAPLPEALTGALDRTWNLIAPHLPSAG